MAIAYLREVDAGTDNACWVVCTKGDPGAVEFVSLIDIWRVLRTALLRGQYEQEGISEHG